MTSRAVRPRETTQAGRRSRRAIRRLSVAATAALAVTLGAACGDDDVTGPADYVWAGTYASAIGCTANFGSASDLRVTADRDVFVGNTMIVDPTVEESSISWQIADGNPHNADIVFSQAPPSERCFSPDITTGPVFAGTIQFPKQGSLSYHGVQ
jgi:hypothetical protein